MSEPDDDTARASAPASKTAPVFFSLPNGYFDWTEEQQRDWAEAQAAELIAKLKPESATTEPGSEGK